MAVRFPEAPWLRSVKTFPPGGTQGSMPHVTGSKVPDPSTNRCLQGCSVGGPGETGTRQVQDAAWGALAHGLMMPVTQRPQVLGAPGRPYAASGEGLAKALWDFGVNPSSLLEITVLLLRDSFWSRQEDFPMRQQVVA